jgi:hypothetical protein
MMVEHDGGASSEGESETEGPTDDLWSSLKGSVGGTELWQVMAVDLLDTDYLPRKGTLSFDASSGGDTASEVG